MLVEGLETSESFRCAQLQDTWTKEETWAGSIALCITIRISPLVSLF